MPTVSSSDHLCTQLLLYENKLSQNTRMLDFVQFKSRIKTELYLKYIEAYSVFWYQLYLLLCCILSYCQSACGFLNVVYAIFLCAIMWIPFYIYSIFIRWILDFKYILLLLLLLDFKNAYDTVSYDILLRKLEANGIKNNVIKLIKQWRAQEFVRGGRKSKRLFFFLLFNFSRGGPAQRIAEKIIFPTKKSSKI